MPLGTTTIDFGAAPGGLDAFVDVTGQGAILTTSHAEAFMMKESTADHTDDEHMIVPVRLTCEEPTAGVGFRICAVSQIPLTGLWAVRWVWSS